jgi:adenylate cyclase
MSARDRIIVHVDAELRDLVPGFLANRKKDADALRAALEEGDLEAIRVIGHNMQGVGRGYGFDGITAIGTSLQVAAKAGKSADITRLTGCLADYVSRVDVTIAENRIGREKASGDEQVNGSRDGQHHILLVDDQEMNRLLISRYLQIQGYIVDYVASGEEALAALEHGTHPAVVLLDVVMPGMNGFEVCRRIKADPATLAIPVVLITSLDSREDRIQAMEAGADDFLSKPVYREELVARIRSLVRLREIRTELQEQHILKEIEKHEQTRRTFERYVSPKLAELILSQKEGAGAVWAKHTRCEAVALFADLRGFTRMSDKLDVDTVADLLNQYFTLLTQAAHRFEGTVFGMAGDGLLIGFNVPFPQHDADRRALLCGCEMLGKFLAIAQAWRKDHGVEVGLGIGINRGEVIVGNIGSPTYMSYTMIGDTVNVAARLTDAAGMNEIVVADSMVPIVKKLLPGLNRELLQPLAVKGKSLPLKIFRIGSDRLIDTTESRESIAPHVLVIDDSEDLRLLVAQYITLEWPAARVDGWDPQTKGRPEDGFDWSDCDVVLLDYHLGAENGLSWLQHFNLDPNCPPVVFLTGAGNEDLAVKAMKLGAVEYLAKHDLSKARVVDAIADAIADRAGKRKAASLERTPIAASLFNKTAPSVAVTGTVTPRQPRAGEPISSLATFPAKDGDRTMNVHIGGYRFTRKIGEGGMSSVYLAHRLLDSLPMVLKILDSKLCQDSVERLRFVREYGIISKLKSRHIVTIYDQGFTDEHVYIAMEYLPGGDLKERIGDGLNLGQAVHYLTEIGEALQTIHAAGVVHRDLKPQNVMFRGDGSLAIIDFGIAKEMLDSNPLTRHGEIYGTPQYMSPEAAQGLAIDRRSDIYSLGAIFYEMLTGQKLFPAETLGALIHKHIHEPIPLLPPEMQQFQESLERMLAKEPEKRYQSVGEMLISIELKFSNLIEQSEQRPEAAAA